MVFVIGDRVQSWCDMRVTFCAPPYLASVCFTSPLYIFHGLALSLKALMKCSPMDVYAFFRENAYVPNMSYGNV